MLARRWLAGVAALALLSTAACSSDAPADDNAPTTVTFWHAYSADSAEIKTLEQTLIPAFQGEHPNVTVKAVSVPYDQLHQKLVTAVAGGELPDVVRADIIWVPELAQLGVLESLDTMLPDFASLTGAMYPGPVATNKWKDHYYGLPLSTNTRVLLYNADVLASAGLAAPTTFDELRAAAATLKPQGVAAFADNDLSGWNVLPWIWSAGGDITDPGVTKATGYLNSAKSVAGVKLLYDLYASGGIPSIITQGGKAQTSEGLATDKYASILDGPWTYPIVASQFPSFTISAGSVPAGPGGSISVVGGEDIVVTKAAGQKKAAADFVRFMVSAKAQQEMAKVGQMPVLSALGDQLTQIQPYYPAFVQQLATARPRPPTPAWTKVDEVLKTQLQEAFTTDGDIQKALDKAAADIDALLAQYA